MTLEALLVGLILCIALVAPPRWRAVSVVAAGTICTIVILNR